MPIPAFQQRIVNDHAGASSRVMPTTLAVEVPDENDCRNVFIDGLFKLLFGSQRPQEIEDFERTPYKDGGGGRPDTDECRDITDLHNDGGAAYRGDRQPEALLALYRKGLGGEFAGCSRRCFRKGNADRTLLELALD